MRHLEIENVDCVHVMDLEASRWITHLKTSPAINVAWNATVHMKKKESDVPAKDVLETHTGSKGRLATPADFFTPAKRKGPREEEDGGVIDLTLIRDSPSEKKARLTNKEEWPQTPTPYSPLTQRFLSTSGKEGMESDGFEMIGSRPAKLPCFPAKTVHEMTTRLGWIVENKSVGTLEQRFSKVFSCDFKDSTYHRHRKSWKYMLDTGMLSNRPGTDLWGPIVQAAESAMKEKGEKADKAL